MAAEKKQSFLGGAAILAFGIVAVKVIGAVFKIPLRNILGEAGSADIAAVPQCAQAVSSCEFPSFHSHCIIFSAKSKIPRPAKAERGI